MVLTERETDEGTLVAVCDADVIGETFENGEVSLTVSESFYDSDAAEHDVEDEQVVESLARCATANIVGERSVALAIEHGFVDAEQVLELGGTRHAQMMWL
ncbi:MAG: DUF424 family protein [Haloarculaceae archaeon]